MLWTVPDAFAGWVENRDGKTVIHVKVHRIPTANAADVKVQADLKALDLFRERFPAIFAERYRDRYKADPKRYGDFNWDDVSVELESFEGILVEGVEVDLLAIAGQIAPDVMYVNFRKSDNYIRNGFLYPLDRPEDGYLSSMTQEELDFRIHEKIWPVIRRKGPDGKEHVWAVPYGGTLGKVLFYRKDLFDEKEIPYPTVDWTWDDLYAAARKLTDPAEGTYGIKFDRGKHEAWCWMSYLWSAGGDAMVQDEETGEWRCVFDTPEAAKALDMYLKLCAEKWIDAEGRVRRGYAYKESADSQMKWQEGSIAMNEYYLDEKLFSSLAPEITGIVPIPMGPTGERGGEINSRMLGLFAEIESPVVRDAAWEYIRFYDSREAVELRTRVMVEGGFGQFVNPKYLRMFGYHEVERLAPKGWAETFDIAIKTGRPEPYGRNSNIAYNMMTLPIQQAEQMMLNDALPEDETERLEVLQGLLKHAVARANEQMLGIVTPAERARRRAIAIGVLLAIVIVFTLGIRRILRDFTPPEALLLAEQGRGKTWRYRWAWILLSPALLAIACWQYFPLLRGSVMSFQDYRLLGNSIWVGLDNFGDVMVNSDWWLSVWNALRYCFLVMSLTFLPPIILAIALQEVPRFKLLFRTIYYLPAVITGLVTMIMWRQFFEASEFGALNAMIMHIPAIGFVLAGVGLFWIFWRFASRLWYHDMRLAAIGSIFAGAMACWTALALSAPIFFPIGEALRESLVLIPFRLFSFMPEAWRWLGDPDTAMVSCVIPMVWAGMGPGCLIYLAALKGIPDDYYEAADIDGATFVDKVLFVIFPILKPLIIINFVGVFIQAWYGAAANILVMTAGGANTEVAGLHIWYKAFTHMQFGPATAMAWLLGFMLIGFTVYQLRILSRVEFKTTGGK